MAFAGNGHPGRRVQYAALPYRVRRDGEVQVRLITSRETRRWVVPKGWPIKGLTPPKTAAREAYEEAGLLGAIARDAIGMYTYEKNLGIRTVLCDVMVFPLKVKRLLQKWPERAQRYGFWFSIDSAAAAVQEEDLRDLILAFGALMATRWAAKHGEVESAPEEPKGPPPSSGKKKAAKALASAQADTALRDATPGASSEREADRAARRAKPAKKKGNGQSLAGPVELTGAGEGEPTQDAPSKGRAQKAEAKKAGSKKADAKKADTKKADAKTAEVGAVLVKKGGGKKTASKKAEVKQAEAKKADAEKTATKKTAAKKTALQKATPRKAQAKGGDSNSPDASPKGTLSAASESVAPDKALISGGQKKAVAPASIPSTPAGSELPLPASRCDGSTGDAGPATVHGTRRTRGTFQGAESDEGGGGGREKAVPAAVRRPRVATPPAFKPASAPRAKTAGKTPAVAKMPSAAKPPSAVKPAPVARGAVGPATKAASKPKPGGKPKSVSAVGTGKAKPSNATKTLPPASKTSPLASTTSAVLSKATPGAPSPGGAATPAIGSSLPPRKRSRGFEADTPALPAKGRRSRPDR